MADKPLKLKELRKILERYDCWEETKRGKGGHTMFFRNVNGERKGFPVPTSKKELERAYQRGVRKAFGLRSEDGVSDDEFYG